MLKILISRTDKIGDVVLTLPMAGLLKALNPHIKIFFLGANYTKDIINASEYIDQFINWDELSICPNAAQALKEYSLDAIIHVFPNKMIAKIAQEAGIKNRIGTNRRWFHWLYCNKLINLTRKKSLLHEAQLNIKLLNGVKHLPGINTHSLSQIIENISIDSIPQYYGLTQTKALPNSHLALTFRNNNKINFIIHPKSGGHGEEWSLENVQKLLFLLPKTQFNIFLTGSLSEKKYLDQIKTPENVHNLSGLFSTLAELTEFIRLSDGLLASGTGPVHLSAALGCKTFGLFPETLHISARRWGALGINTENYSIKISPEFLAQKIIDSFQAS